jgi:hypothetical protein
MGSERIDREGRQELATYIVAERRVCQDESLSSVMGSRLVSMGLYQYGIPSLSLSLSGNRIEVQKGMYELCL